MLHLSNHKKRQFLPEQMMDLDHTKSQFFTLIFFFLKKKSEAYYLIGFQADVLTTMKSLKMLRHNCLLNISGSPDLQTYR